MNVQVLIGKTQTVRFLSRSANCIGVSMPPFQKTSRSAYLNFLRAKYEMYTGQVVVKSYPYYLCIDPCDLCQLRCPTCPTGIENESRRGNTADNVTYRNKRSMLADELFDALLDELGEYLFLIMFYNYGEPLLNRNLADFIRKAKGKNIETEIHTNLSLPLSDHQIDDLLSSGLDYLNASIDGFSQETYQIHRVGGNLELVKHNLERLAKARDRLGLKTTITYNLLVFSFNEHEIPAAKRYCQKLGITFSSRDAFIQNPDWLPSYRKNERPFYSETEMKALASQWEVVGKGDYWAEHEKHPFWIPFRQREESKFPPFCTWHYGVSVVTAGGPVAPCCAAAKESDDFGTVIPGLVSFADIWNNDRYRKSRAAFARKDIQGLENVDTVCTRCYFPKFVQHLYSLHDVKVIAQFHRVFKGSDPVLERAYKLLSRPRYGRAIHALLQRGMFHPLLQLLTGNGNENDTAKFVDFFEKNLINAFPPSRLESPARLDSPKGN